MSSRKPDPPNPKAPRGSTQLSLEDTRKSRGLAVKRRTTGGYNPYDAVGRGKPTPQTDDKRKKPTDLRKLSEWIRHRREIDELNKKG